MAVAGAETTAASAGPVDPGTQVRLPPVRPESKLVQTLSFVRNPLQTSLAAHRRFGDTWSILLLTRKDPIAVTCHPDHIKALLTAGESTAPSMTGESPLRPVLGPNSVLTANGAVHMRQRKLLLPSFHGDAIARYLGIIEQATERELARWRPGTTFALAPRMQALTLEVITAGIYGIDSAATGGHDERRMSDTLRLMMRASTNPLWQLVELHNVGRHEPRGVLRAMRRYGDRIMDAVIHQRRREHDGDQRHDILSLLLQTRDEDGQPLSDAEIRDELLTLVLAGHETTANQLAWAQERLLRTPAAYDRLRETVRGSGNGKAEDLVEATIHEAMRTRPVIPVIGRIVLGPWRLGEYVVPAGTPVTMNIAALHHRSDIYSEPFSFRPERFLDEKPGTYTWIPFGGGVRRCLGASLAMAEQRIVLRAITERFDLTLADDRDEPARQRNVTMIPSRGVRVTVSQRLTR